MEVESVLHFLRKNGLYEVELALKEDVSEKGLIGPCDLEKFLFPMNTPLPPVKVPGSSLPRCRQEGSDKSRGWNSGSETDTNSSENEEFVSMVSSTTGLCSSDFTNPYGCGCATQADSDTSSDRLSQFGTAREYGDLDMNTGIWYGEKDDGHYMSPAFRELDPLGCEDKFIMTSNTQTQCMGSFDFNHMPHKDGENCFEDPFAFDEDSKATVAGDQHKDYYLLDESCRPKRSVTWDLGGCTGGGDHKSCDGVGGGIGECDHVDLKEALNKLQLNISGGNQDLCPEKNSATVFFSSKDMYPAERDEFDNDDEVLKSSPETVAAMDGQEVTTLDEVPFLETAVDEYEVFDLRIIHRKNRTGFEENKDLPIIINTMLAGRYYVTEYLGSAAFSRVIQAHDIQTGVDVCLKIIKNDKDFFDQSLDEIKLLKYVNKHDPSDERHILRLYDYFYHQEHLFIVCELLRANLYEFQKYNLESGGEPYFTMRRLQAITQQCLEALDYLHGLGVIHCDLKPENILIKSYSRCEIKVIDLGSSCFQTDSLSLYVQSRSYRAPEVILGLPYGPKIDLWSLGCILAELCSGEVLFPNDGVVMLLARMIALLGPMDLELLLRGQETRKYFTREHDLYQINEETNQVEYIVLEESSLEQELPVYDAGFIDFVKFLLQINPRKRPTAKDALQHPWLSQPYSDL